MQGKYFDELEVGDQFTSHRRTLTETDIINFICIIGLLNPLFTELGQDQHASFSPSRLFSRLSLSGPEYDTVF